MNEANYTKLVGELRQSLAVFKPGYPTYDQIVAPRDKVFAKYRPVFSSEHAPRISAEEFSSFLYFENNCHWSGLYRKGLAAINDMDSLRAGLTVLLDESRSIRDRFPEALDMVSGLGRAIATGILTVAYPDKYGVWNNTSEGALRKYGVWPDVERGEGDGARYEKINVILLRLCADLGIDLWTLDAIWWSLLDPDVLPTPVKPIGTGEGGHLLFDSIGAAKRKRRFVREEGALELRKSTVDPDRCLSRWRDLF